MVAVSVSAFVQRSFQIAVLRSNVNRAPGAEVITCGSVTAKVMVKIACTSSSVRPCCEPAELGCVVAAAVLNV